MRVLLQPHPTTRRPVVRRITVDCRRRGDRLRLSYRIMGAAERIRWPEPKTPARTDELWRSTCLEVFVQTPDGYREFNASPSGEWASYRFAAYRKGMEVAREELTVESRARRADVLELDLALELPPGAGRLALSAVIEEIDGQICYWAAAHPEGKPDFHHPDSFALTLPAPEVP